MVIESEHKSRRSFNVINTSERSTFGPEGSLNWYPGSKMFRKNSRRRSDRYIIQRTMREKPCFSKECGISGRSVAIACRIVRRSSPCEVMVAGSKMSTHIIGRYDLTGVGT